MRLFTTEEMLTAEHHAMEKIGISGLTLMENAGIKSLITLEKILGGLKNKRFAIICGKGNNGGDGLVIARHLFNNEIPVQVFVIAEPSEMSAEARVNFEILIKSGMSPLLLKENIDIDRLRIALEFSDCIIDCLFGTGVKGNIKGFIASVIFAMNDTRAVKVSIDLPSGLCATTGKLSDPTFNAGYTITLGVPKLGLFLFPGKRVVGEIWIADIGLPALSIASVRGRHTLLSGNLVTNMIPERDDDIHKGTTGKVLVMAGSQEYPGAGIMASCGALRSGAGIIHLMLPDCLRGNLPFQILPETVVNYLPSKNGGFDISEEMAYSLTDKFGCILVGSGWGRDMTRVLSITNILKQWRGTIVLDADALNCVEDTSILKKTSAKIIITPHLGEMARLTKKSIEEIKNNQIEIARRFSSENNLIVVLKSSVTVIAEPDGHVYLCSRPNSGLARGGSGDLLAGLICGMLANKLDVLSSVLAAVWIHSEAAETARLELGEDAMTISEVAMFIPSVFKKLRNGEFLKNI